ncbi:MAG: serine/threonine protein kinase [Candidatus Schekmanbacteria bacterium]|nr:serine/threonine protein kinase [Candidatus Schekmanbacteria bacterium]
MRKGTRFGRYTIVEEIGVGATATVYRAEDSGEVVALKILHRHLVYDPVVRERFRREVEIVRGLRGPGIVRVYDLISFQDEVAIVAEHCAGGSLAAWRASSADELVSVAWQVAEALRVAHDHGVIHRDLKPANILRAADGKLKIADFGSARLQALSGLTTSSAFLGTPQFVAPEAFDGLPPDPRGDLYALGAILYQAATGRSHLDENRSSMLWSRRSEAVPIAPRQLNPALPVWLEELILSLLGPLYRRPPDAAALLSWIEQRQSRAAETTKKCLHCRAALPTSAPLCPECGKEALVIRPIAGPNATALLLIRIPEDARARDGFRELLEAVSGQTNLALPAFLGADRWLFSRAEKARGKPLPALVATGMPAEVTRVLVSELSRIGVEAVSFPQDKARRQFPDGPLIRLRCDPPRVVGAGDLIAAAVAALPSIPGGRHRQLFYECFVASYEIARQAHRLSMYALIGPTLANLQTGLRAALARLTPLEKLMAAVNEAEVYAEITRLDHRIAAAVEPAAADELSETKMAQTRALESRRALELQHARLMARLLRAQGSLMSAAERLRCEDAPDGLAAIAESVNDNLLQLGSILREEPRPAPDC